MTFNYDIDLSSKRLDIDKEKINDEMNKIYKEIVNKIEKVIILRRDVGLGTSLRLDDFVTQRAGLFTADVLGGFLKRGMVRPESTVTKTRDSMNELEFKMHANLDEQAQKQLQGAPAKFILSQAGGLDPARAKQIFNDVMGEL
jgi:hypothetical protein